MITLNLWFDQRILGITITEKFKKAEDYYKAILKNIKKFKIIMKDSYWK